MEAITPEELRAVKRFNRDAGCDFPDMECDYCEAFVRAMRDPSVAVRGDPTLKVAYRAGAVAAFSRLKAGI